MLTAAAQAAVVAAVAVLGLAAAGKAVALGDFRLSLSRAGLGRAARPVSVAVPLVELGVVAALVVVGPQRSAVLAVAVLAAATVYLAATIDRGETCACLGAWSGVSRGRALRRNGLLLALAGAGAVGAPASFTNVLVVVAGVCLAAAVLLVEQTAAAPPG